MLFLFQSRLLGAEKDESLREYNNHLERINNLYTTSLKLSKLAKENKYSDERVYAKIKENIQLVTKLCSESLESQLYYQAQKQNRESTEYNYQFSQISKDLFNKRNEIYRKCKRVKALLSRSSFKFGKKHHGQTATIEIHNHQVLFENTKHVYSEVKSISEKLKDERSSLNMKLGVIRYYQNYKNFNCDWEYENKLYANAKVYLRAQIVAQKNIEK
ncbi:MAG: hypothetical protein KDD40_09140, partial [Bdellovibrionales bacterium]|nr:hypothetical protein [Bdellovibrionales bacterium]